jgi:hypothetical protein
MSEMTPEPESTGSENQNIYIYMVENLSIIWQKIVVGYGSLIP